MEAIKFRKCSKILFILFLLIHCVTMANHHVLRTSLSTGNAVSGVPELMVPAFSTHCERFRDFERRLFNSHY